jgi:transposase
MRRIPRVTHTLEYKLEAVRRIRSGEATRAVAREIGVAEQTLRNWCKAQAAVKLGSAEKGKLITPEQMEISRLRAENARPKMEAEILKSRGGFN